MGFKLPNLFSNFFKRASEEEELRRQEKERIKAEKVRLKSEEFEEKYFTKPLKKAEEGIAGFGRKLQQFPETTVKLSGAEKAEEELKGKGIFGEVMASQSSIGRKGLEFISGLPGEVMRGYGRTTEKLATSEGRKELAEFPKRVKEKGVGVHLIADPTVQAVFDVTDFLPGIGLLGMGTRAVGKEATEKLIREGAEKMTKEAAEKLSRETAEKATREASEKILRETGEKVVKETEEAGFESIQRIGEAQTRVDPNWISREAQRLSPNDRMRGIEIEKELRTKALKDRQLAMDDLYRYLEPKHKIGDIVEVESEGLLSKSKVKITGADFNIGQSMDQILRTGFPSSFRFDGLIGKNVETGEGLRIYSNYLVNGEILSDTIKKDSEEILSEFLKRKKNIQIGEPAKPVSQPIIGEEVDAHLFTKKAIEETVEKIPKEAGEMIAEEAVEKDARKELFDFIEKSKPLERKQAMLYTESRAGKLAKLKTVETTGEKGYFERLASLSGEMPRLPQFEPPEFAQKTVDDLHDFIFSSNKLDEWEKISAEKGLNDILDGSVPIKSSIEKLERVFGSEFTTNLEKLLTKWQKASGIIGELAGVPRSLMAGGFDMSYGLRQGIFGAWKHPKEWVSSFKDQFKWFLKEENLTKSMAEIKSRETFPLMQKAKLAITDMSSNREEQYISSLAEKIPGVGKLVRASGRAYTGFASKYRADIFDFYIGSRTRMGQPIDEYYLKNLGNWVNSMTGRGSLGKFESVAKETATALFSPRYFKSTIDKFNPVYYAKLHPDVRKEAIKTLAAFTAGTMTTLLLADQFPGVSVEWKENTSADFLKIKIGNTRIDIMGGMQQPVVLASRIFENKLVSTTTGKEIKLGEGYRPLTKWDLVQSFFENKTTPVISFLIGAMRGSTSIGEPFEPDKEAVKRMIPIFLQDMVDLSNEGSLELFPVVAPLSFFGAGTQTYGQDKGVSGESILKKYGIQSERKTESGEDILKKYGITP